MLAASDFRHGHILLDGALDAVARLCDSRLIKWVAPGEKLAASRLTVAWRTIGQQLGQAFELPMRYTTRWSRIVCWRTDGRAPIKYFDANKKRKRSPKRSPLEPCAPQFNFDGMHAPTKAQTASTWMFAACGIWLIALGIYFIVLRPPLLPEDPRFMGTTFAQIRADVPGLENWLKRVFTVMGGFMAGAGVLTVFLATTMRLRLRGTYWAMALSGALTVGLMSATNFALHSDFRWVLLLPALVWFAGVAAYVPKR